MNNINNAIEQAINSIRAAFPAATEPELNKILVDLRIIPATPTTEAISQMIDMANMIKPIPATPSEKNNTTNTPDSIGGISMPTVTVQPTPVSTQTTEDTAIKWKAMPQFSVLAHTVNDCRANRMTWFKFFTSSFSGIGFNNIIKFNSQVSALCELYPDDTELRTVAEIIGTIGTIIRWGDISEQTLNNFSNIQTAYIKASTNPRNKTQILTELMREIEGYADILNEDEHLYNNVFTFFGETFANDCKTIARLLNIAKIGNDESKKSTNAKANTNTNTNRNTVAENTVAKKK